MQNDVNQGCPTHEEEMTENIVDWITYLRFSFGDGSSIMFKKEIFDVSDNVIKMMCTWYVIYLYVIYKSGWWWA